MTSLRFFIDVESFDVGDSVLIEGKEFHHIRDVIRIEEGERLVLVNGRGSIATGIVDRIERHQAVIRILDVERRERPNAKLVVGLPLLRPNHLDFAIEKGTEVGVDTFVLFPGEKSEKKEVFPSLQRRLDALIIAATKQSGRAFFPEIQIAHSLQDALRYLPSPRLWADLHKSSLFLTKRLEEIPQKTSLSVLIGPESGWSDGERKILLAEGPPVLLHHNVLRAETAMVVAAYTASLWVHGGDVF